MSRRLSTEALADYLEGGIYQSLLEIVQSDGELALEIRTNNRVMVYCEKNLILTIKYSKKGNDTITMLSDRYLTNRNDDVKLTATLNSPTDFKDVSRVRAYFSQAKNLCKNYKHHEEFKVQQWYKSQLCTSNDKYLALDMEWAPDQKKVPESERLKDKTQIDLLLVDNALNAKGEHDIYLAEVKCGFGAIDGASGLSEHLRLTTDVINNVYTRHNVWQDATSLIEQKYALGLIDTGGLEYKLSKKPRVMFILAYTSPYQIPHLKRSVEELCGSDDLRVEYLDVSHLIGDGPATSSRNESAYKTIQRRHQEKFRRDVLKLEQGKIANWLTDADARNLNNFVPVFHKEIEQALYHHYKRMPKDQGLLNDMLSSKCVPWNIFVPMMTDKKAASQVLMELLGICKPIEIGMFKIEYPTGDLNDGTAFDAYFEYYTEDGLTGAVGIEVKYTEEGYSVSEIEYEKMKDRESTYAMVTRDSGCFINTDPLQFNYPGFIQVWRNHMLGLAMLQRNKVEIFHSLTLYPSGNTHFASTKSHKGALDLYKELLTEKGKNTIVAITYDYLIEVIKKHYHSERYDEWIKYLEMRYTN